MKRSVSNFQPDKVDKLKCGKECLIQQKIENEGLKDKMKASTFGTLIISKQRNSFEVPNDVEINLAELQRIKVNIYRKIPAKMFSNKLQRGIIDPEDVILNRKDGEGSKPIFHRDEIKKTVLHITEKIKELHKITTISNVDLAKKFKISKRQTRQQSPSSRFKRPRLRERSHNRGKSRECREDIIDENSLEKPKDDRNHMDFKKRGKQKWNRNFQCSYKASKIYFECPCEKNRKKESKERPVCSSHIMKQNQFPIYYGNFFPRPLISGSMISPCSQVPLMVALARPFVLSNEYKFGPPNVDNFNLSVTHGLKKLY